MNECLIASRRNVLESFLLPSHYTIKTFIMEVLIQVKMPLGGKILFE
jgi:hypothetical protein